MKPTTAALLRAEADPHSYGQAHPTDRRGIAKRFKARARAVDAWVRAGPPDLPPGASKPAITPKAEPGRSNSPFGCKDWSPVEVYLEVVRRTDRALILTDGDKEHLVPQSQVKNPEGHVIGEDLHPRDCGTMKVPRFMAIEAGWL